MILFEPGFIVRRVYFDTLSLRQASFTTLIVILLGITGVVTTTTQNRQSSFVVPVSSSNGTSRLPGQLGAIMIANVAQTITRFISNQTTMAAGMLDSIVVSPISIAGAISLLLQVSQGNTQIQLLRLLGFKDPYGKHPRPIVMELDRSTQLVVDRVSALRTPNVCIQASDLDNLEYSDEYSDDDMEQQPVSPAVIVRIANAFFVPSETVVNQVNRRMFDRHTTNVSVQAVDFANSPEQARITLNRWVVMQTNGLVREMFSSGSITSRTQFVIANALYFRATWSTSFTTKRLPLPFYPLGRNVPQPTTKAPGMHIDGCFPFYETSQVRILGLPYGTEGGVHDSEYTAYVLMTTIDPYWGSPVDTGPQRINNLLHLLNVTTLNALMDATIPSHMSIDIPRLKLSSKVQLHEVLQRVGVTAPFMPGTIDFATLRVPGSSTLPHLSQMQHVVELILDEGGTEGAAVTASVLDRAYINRKRFIVDEPFVLAIRHDPTRTLLFYGPVYRPAPTD